MTEHPTLPGRLASATISDSEQSWPVRHSRPVYDSPFLSVQLDTIVDPSGLEHPRVVVRPNGAVGVLAIDDDDRVLFVEQYRHPVGRRLLELPAGTLDVAGEAPLEAAKRELAEEADVLAAEWSSILHLLATPGYSTEGWEVFLATQLSPVPVEDRTPREAEEADMAQWWIPFDEAIDAILDGRIVDSLTVAAMMAAHVQRSR